MKKDSIFSSIGVTNSKRKLHTPGSFAKNNLLFVQEVGKLYSLQAHKSQREKLESILFIGIVSGRGEIKVGDILYNVSEGDCIIINCHSFYSHESSKDSPWELIWVHFYGKIAEAYYKLFYEHNSSCNVFRATSFGVFINIIDKLIFLQDTKGIESELESNIYLLELMNKSVLDVIRNDDSHEKMQKLCNDIRKYINEHLNEEQLDEKISIKYEVDKKSLDESFLKIFGIHLEAYIMNRRFTTCKEMLRFTAKSVDDIANTTGIKDVQVLYKIFLEEEGMSAEEYRMKWSQWIK